MRISDEQLVLIINEVVRRFLVPKFRGLGMNATGEWLGSVETSASNQIAIIRARDYTEFLANGRPPGDRPEIAPLIKWASAKFGLGYEQAKSAAFGIANKIAAEGTTWYQKGGTDLIEVLESPECLDFIRGELTSIMAIDAQSEITNFMKDEFKRIK